MKKSLLLFAVMAVPALMATAQTSSTSGLGVNVNWDYSVPASNLSGLNSGSGVSGGIIYDVPLGHDLFIEPGVNFFYDTMDFDYFDLLYLNDKKLGINSQLRNYGFRVPLMLGYKIDLVDDIAISVMGGAQLNVGLGEKMHYSDKNISDIDLYDRGWRRCDMQVKFGLKFHYMDNFFAELTGAIGVTNMIDGKQYAGSHIRRNLVSLGVGYKF